MKFHLFKGAVGWVVGAAALAAAYYAFQRLQGAAGNTAAGAPPQPLSGSSESISSIPTGLDSLTPGAMPPTTFVGLPASIVNSALGGAPQNFGNWVGQQLSTSDESATLSRPSISGNPYGAGSNNAYAPAVNASPIDAVYAATPYVVPYAA